MGLWDTMLRLPQHYRRRVLEVYKNKESFFPIEVREHLSEWIEKHILIDIDTDDPDQTKYIKVVMTKFLKEMECALVSLRKTDQKVKIKNILQQVIGAYALSGKPIALEYFQAIRECLLKEMRIVTRYEAECRCLKQMRSTSILSMPAGKYNDDKTFVQLLAEAGGGSQDLLGLIRELEGEQRKFVDMYEEAEEISRFVVQMGPKHWNQNIRMEIHKRNAALQDYIEKKVQTVTKLRQEIAHCAELLVKDLVKLTEIAQGFFTIWRRERGPRANSGDPGIELDALQECYEHTYRSVLEMLAHLARAKRLHDEVEIDSSFIFCKQVHILHIQSSELIHSLKRISLIVEEEPPQLLKPGMRFSATLCIFMPDHLNNLNVKATAYLVDQNLALAIFSRGVTNALVLDKYGLLNGQGELEFYEEERILRVTFRDMKVRSDTVASSRDAFWLAFRVQYLTTDGTIVRESWESSLAMAIAKSPGEIRKALALVIWNNAFADGSVIEKFIVPLEVNWFAYGNMLSQKLKGFTGRGLFPHHLYFLGKMIFNCDDRYRSYAFRNVTYKQQHENLYERDFSFWDWFSAAMMLAQKHINQLWHAGLISGFATIEQAKVSLQSRVLFPGTFIIIFSTREPGAVDIVYIKGPTSSHIEHLTFTSKELVAEPLHIRLMNLTQLRFFFPLVPKEKMLRLWCSNSCRSNLVWGIGCVQQAKLLLGSKSPIGTFVAVLSRSRPGAVDLVWVVGTGRDRFRWATFTRDELNYVPLHQRVMDMKELKYLLKGLKPKEDVVKKCCQGRNQGRIEICQTKTYNLGLGTGQAIPNTPLLIDLSSDDEVKYSSPMIVLSDDVESNHLTNMKMKNDVRTEFMDIPSPSPPPTPLLIDLSSDDEVKYSSPMIVLSDDVESNHLTNMKMKNDVRTEFMDIPPPSSQNELSTPTLSSIESRTTPKSCQSIKMNDNVKENKSNNDAIMYSAKVNDYDGIIDNVKEKNNMNNTFWPQLDDTLSFTEILSFMSKANGIPQPKHTMSHENTLNEKFPVIDDFDDMDVSKLVEYLFQDISRNVSSRKDLPNSGSYAKSISSNFDISKSKSLSHNTPVLNELENMRNNTVFCENKVYPTQSIPNATSPKIVELGTESIFKNALCNPSTANGKSHYNNIPTKTDASGNETSTTESHNVSGSKNIVNAAEISQTRSFPKEISLDENASCDGSHLKTTVSTRHTSDCEFLSANYPHVTNALNTEPHYNNIHSDTDFLPSWASLPYLSPETTVSNFMSLLASMSCTAGVLSNSMNMDNNMTMGANSNHNPARFNPQGESDSAPPQQYMLANAHNQSLLRQITADPNVITNDYISEKMDIDVA